METCALKPSISRKVHKSAFPATVASSYWASNTYATNTANAWYVNFGDGVVAYTRKIDRCPLIGDLVFGLLKLVGFGGISALSALRRTATMSTDR